MSSSKKSPVRQVFICLNPPPPPLPLNTVYVHVLIHIGKGGGEVNQREGYRETIIHKASSKIPT